MEFPVKPRLAHDGPDEIMNGLGFAAQGQTAACPAVDALILKQDSSAGRITVLENYKMTIAGVDFAHASMILQNGQTSVVTQINKLPHPELHKISLSALMHGDNPIAHPVSSAPAIAMPAQQQVARIMPDKTIFLKTKPFQFQA